MSSRSSSRKVRSEKGLPKNMRRLPTDAQAFKEGCYYHPDSAKRVRDFFERFLRHSKGQWAGKPFALLDWQWNNVIQPVFGWKRANGTRRFRKAYVEIPKKNGKSALCSGISLYMLIGDCEPGAEVYSAAADRMQASIVFEESANMVEASPALSRHMEILRSKKRINLPSTKGWYQALSADVPTKEGLNIHSLVFDELHVQKTRALWDTLAYGGAARRQPLLIAITTAGIYDPQSIGWEQHKYAQGVSDGAIDDWEYFSYICGATQEDDWKDPEIWRKANPSFEVTIQQDEMAAACKEAQNAPSKVNSFLRYRLNVWTQQIEAWLDIDLWDQCQGELPPIEEMTGYPCYAAMDLSSTMDITALVYLFVVDGEYWIYPYFWAPESAAQKRERINQHMYRNWERDGHLVITPGDVMDYQAIRQHLLDCRDKGIYCDDLAFDPWNATQLAVQLAEEDGFNTIEFRQGYASMNEPSKRLEEMIADRQIKHNGHPVLKWMVNNVSKDDDPAGNIKPSKKKSTEKIDGVVALVMAIGRMLRGTVDNFNPIEVW